MICSVIVKVPSYYSCKFNCTFPKRYWTLKLALPPNGNVRELFFIASLKSGCFCPDFIFSGKSQTSKRRDGLGFLELCVFVCLFVFPQ